VPAGPARLEAHDPATARTGVAVGGITAEGEILSLDVRAQGLGTVTGIVTAGAQPQPAAQIELVSGTFRLSALTDGEGRYRIAGVPEGLVSVSARVNGGIQSGTASATLTGDGTELTLDVSVRDSGTLTGTVVAAAGAALPQVVVTARAAGLTFTATVGSDGGFEFPRLPAGLVLLDADAIGSIDTARLRLTLPGSATTDVQLQMRGVGSISGRALDSAGQPTGGSLTIDGGDDEVGRYSISITVGGDGAFRFPELLSGAFSARLRVTTGTVTLYGTATGTIAPGLETTIDVRLQDSATVTGLVLRADGQTPAIGSDAVLKLAAGPQVPVQVQADGRFTASGIPLGAFTLTVKDPFTGGVALVRDRSTGVNGEVLDLGAIVLDDTLVTAVAVDPPDGAVGVAVTRAVAVTFSDPLQSPAGVSLRRGTTSVAATASLSADGRTVTLQPPGTSAWPDAAELTVLVSTAATDIYGRHPAEAFSSRFHTVDLSPPSIVSTLPIHQAIEVAVTSGIEVTFSEPLAESTDLAALITVTGPAGAVAGTAHLGAPAVATFTPAWPLLPNAVYSVVVNGAIDATGNRQTTAFAFIFATPDSVAPALSLQLPAGEWQRSPRPHIQVLLTDNASGVDSATGTLTIDGQPVAAQQLASHLAFTPATDLAEGMHSVEAAVRDRAGNPGAGAFALRIDTVAPDVPVIGSLVDGQTVRGTIALGAASADATSGLASIRYYRGTSFIGEATAAPFQVTYDTGPLVDGPYEFRALAVDVAGNTTPLGPSVAVWVDNDPLTLTIAEPAANARVRASVLVRVTPSEAVSRVDFTVGSTTVSDSAAPYEQTLDVTGVPEGTVSITVTAHPVVGEPATKVVSVVADRTPPPAPDAARIDAEPPAGSASLVVGRTGAVEAHARVEIANATAAGDPVYATATANGAFATSIGGSVDDLLTLVAIDDVGNRSAATIVVIRRTPSLPPAEGATSLTFEGVVADRVGAAAGAVAPDGELDAVFTLTLAVGEGMTRTLAYVDLAGPAMRSTRPAAAAALGVAIDAGAPLLNGPDGTVGFPIVSGATLTLIASDFGFVQEGATYVATAVFTDGSRFVGTYYHVPAADRARIAHSLTATASPATVVVSPGLPASTTITLSDIRDLDGTRVPDGAKVAIAVADMAAKDARGNPIRSAGGEIVDGEIASNNPAFRIFTVNSGTVTATYSSGGIVPAPIRGALAVVQVLGADEAGNVLGTHVVGAMGLNVRAAADRAIVQPAFSSVYADMADRRVRVSVQVRDEHGAPVADGTRVVVTAASGVATDGTTTIASAGGAVFGGADSPSGSFYRALTIVDGRAEFEYSPVNVIASVDATSAAVLQVLPATATGVRSSSVAIGTAIVTLTAAADAEIHLSPASAPVVFPARPVQVRVHHVHDLWAGLVPDGAPFLLTATSNVLTFRGTTVTSAGGTILDGGVSPSGSFYRAFTLDEGEVLATYAAESVTSLQSGETAVAWIQVVAATPTLARLTSQAVAIAPLSLVAPAQASGAADPPTLLADGSLHTTTVTFGPVLDAFGNPLPEGSKVVATVSANAATRDGQVIPSAGGQILNGTDSPSGSSYRVFTVQNGAVSILYGDQNLTSLPGETRVANVSLLPATATGARQSGVALGVVPIALAGLTTAEVAASPAAVHADGADRRVSMTIANLRDASGQPVPDGTWVGVTAATSAAITADGCCIIQSAGGTIVGGTGSTSNANFKVFPVVNGQVTFEYSASPVSVPIGEATAVVSVVPARSSGALISTRVIGTASIRLLAPSDATITASPVDVLADGANRAVQLVLSGFADTSGVPTPDGARIGLTAASSVAVTPDGCCVILSAGGTITAPGTVPGDGTASTTNSNFRLFTIAGGEVHAGYSTGTITAGVGETKVATVAAVHASATSDALLTTRAFATGTINLRGMTSATSTGPSTALRAGAPVSVTFSGIKDSAGNTVPDGTMVGVTAASNVTTDGGTGTLITSAGGTIVDGTLSSNTNFRVFPVINGTVTVTYQPPASAGTARIAIVPARPDGSIIQTKCLVGAVWTIVVQ
jgi:hypothetical protein